MTSNHQTLSEQAAGGPHATSPQKVKLLRNNCRTSLEKCRAERCGYFTLNRGDSSGESEITRFTRGKHAGRMRASWAKMKRLSETDRENASEFKKCDIEMKTINSHHSSSQKARENRKDAPVISRLALIAIERQHPGFPAFLEVGHVALAKDGLQRVVACGIGFCAVVKAAVELFQEVVLLQVQAQIAGLAVIRAGVVIVELIGRGAAQRFECRQPAGADGLLQSGESPVHEADDLAVLFARLFVERGQAFIKPRRALRKIRGDVGVHNFVHQRAAAGGDVHHQSPMLRRVISIGRVRLGAEEFFRVLFVAVFVGEEPDIDNQLRIALEVAVLQAIDRPFNRVRGPFFDALGRLIANDHERRLDDDGEGLVAKFGFQGLDVPVILSLREGQRWPICNELDAEDQNSDDMRNEQGFHGCLRAHSGSRPHFGKCLPGEMIQRRYNSRPCGFNGLSGVAVGRIASQVWPGYSRQSRGMVIFRLGRLDYFSQTHNAFI